jgi:CBS-domain-containing membrane protein
VATLIASVQKAESLMTSLKSKHPWIKDSEQLFGTEGAFDFAKENIPDCRKRLNAFEEQHSKLRKTINFNVMDMIDR